MDKKSLFENFVIEKVPSLSPKEVTRLHFKYLNNVAARLISFTGLHQRFIKGEGIYLTDVNGRRYLDFISGYGACNLGHEPQEVLNALRSVEGMPNIFQAGLNPYAGKLAELLAEITPGALSRAFFCSSGAEGVESAIKLARIATQRTGFVSTEGSFHGKTFGALSVSGREKYQHPFEPLVPGVKRIPFDGVEALELALRDRDVAAFIVEPIQGEGGVIVPNSGYLKEAEKICHKYGTLLILDEIQTGMGRTGKLFCCEYDDVEPDILVLSKSLGGGVMPIAAMITTDELWKKAYGSLQTCLLHSTTFGGNTRACVCGIAAIKAILDKNLIKNARIQGEYLLKGLNELKEKYAIIKDARGKGLMIGLQFARLKGKGSLVEGLITLWIAKRLLAKHHIITAFTLNNYDVLRIAPPLCITREQCDEFLHALDNVCKSAEKIAKIRLIK